MGTWGTGVLQDDTVADVIGFAKDHLKRGVTFDDALALVQSHFSELEQDADEGPLLWLAIAQIQWQYDQVDSIVLNRVRKDIDAENGLDGWRDDPKALSQRKSALARFLTKIEQPNPKPSALPKLVVRRAPYEKGDCLSVRLADGNYTACLVLDVNNADPEQGMNLVAGLDYYEPEPPSKFVFSKRQWLKKSFGNWNGQLDVCWYLPIGYRTMRTRISVVDTIKIKWTDRKKSGSYTRWDNLGTSIAHSRAASSSTE